MEEILFDIKDLLEGIKILLESVVDHNENIANELSEIRGVGLYDIQDIYHTVDAINDKLDY